MKLTEAHIYIPDGRPFDDALARTTHLGVGAHPDDLEFMCWHGIQQCLEDEAKGFTGVIVTNGSGSPRSGRYASYSDAEMMVVRREEQQKAAALGRYSALITLDFASDDIRAGLNEEVVDALDQILRSTRPEYIYTHNLADRHDTHVAVALALIAATRRQPADLLPRRIYGCEVWRSLDWMLADDQVALAVDGHDDFMLELMRLFDSQIAGGKRYDIATLGRKHANATYHGSHVTDECDALELAMDLTPLAADPSLDASEYVGQMIEHFAHDVRDRLARLKKVQGQA